MFDVNSCNTINIGLQGLWLFLFSTSLGYLKERYFCICVLPDTSDILTWAMGGGDTQFVVWEEGGNYGNLFFINALSRQFLSFTASKLDFKLIK